MDLNYCYSVVYFFEIPILMAKSRNLAFLFVSSPVRSAKMAENEKKYLKHA